MTHNPQPLHLDPTFAEKSVLATNSQVCNSGLTVGVSVEYYFRNHCGESRVRRDCFPNPVFLNDTLNFETEVMHSRMSASRPETGIVTFEHRAFKQSGELVCRCRRNALMHCIPSENKLDND